MSGKERRTRVVIGALCGLATGIAISALMLVEDPATVSLLPIGSPGVHVVGHLGVAATLGAVFGWISPRSERAHAALTSSGLILGLLWWIIGPLTVIPLVRGTGTMWTLTEAAPTFASLIAALLHGSLTGLCLAIINSVGVVDADVSVTSLDDDLGSPTRVVIVGGGFGGVAVAQRLEELALDGSGIDVTLISDRNFLLFTPMLAEVAASSVEPHHISAPVRVACPRTRFIHGRATNIDLGDQIVHVADAPRHRVRFDHLVLALGSVADDRDVPGVDEHCFTLKSLDDATDLRNHLITMLERADVEEDVDERRRLLTFTVAGGGFAGTEMIAEICDLAHSSLRHYPSVPIGELRFVLVHSRDRILPEIGRHLAAYALEKLRARGIEAVLDTYVESVSAQALTLDDGTEIATRTVVWTAGNQPNPLVADLECEHGESGAVVTDSTLAVVGATQVWALGDCGLIPDPDSVDGGYCPPTAQYATRQGTTVADNILAVERGREAQPFVFSSLGTLVALGHRTAVAEIRGRRFSGFLAWFMWRTIYLFKLPSLEKKVRVVVDWTVELLFPRDIVLTNRSSADRSHASPSAQPELEADHAGVDPQETVQVGR